MHWLNKQNQMSQLTTLVKLEIIILVRGNQQDEELTINIYVTTWMM